MKNVSRLLQGITSSATVAISDKARELKAQGHDVKGSNLLLRAPIKTGNK